MADYNYTFDKKVEFSAEEEARFRKLMDKWADSVEGYTGKKFGKELQIKEVWDTPVYVSSLKYQNDQRTIEHTYEKYKGQMMEPRTVFDQNGFNRWEVCAAPQPFTENKAAFYVRGSKYVDNCPSCHGNSIVKCGICSGSGSTYCPTCNGTKTVTEMKEDYDDCRQCDGKGKTYTTRYDYRTNPPRTISEAHKCWACNGSGKITKKVPTSVTCPTCFGTGVRRCTTCQGTGRIKCSTCDASGKVMYSWIVRQQSFVKERNLYVITPLLTDEEQKKYLKDFDRTDGKVVFKQCNEGISFNKEELERQDLMVKSLTALTNDLKNGTENHITYNEFSVKEYEAKTVKYELDGKEYICILQGTSWDVFSIKSPISDFMDDLKQKVINYSEHKQYGKAWTVMKKILKFPQAGENERRVKKKLEDAMLNSATLGKRLSMIVFLLIVFPLFSLPYDNHDYMITAQWTHWLDGFLHVTHGLDVLVFCLFDAVCMFLVDIPSVFYKYENTYVRIGMGLLFGLLIQTIFLGIFFMLNWIGIVTLFDFVVFWAFMIVFFIITIVFWIIKTIIGWIF